MIKYLLEKVDYATYSKVGIYDSITDILKFLKDEWNSNFEKERDELSLDEWLNEEELRITPFEYFTKDDDDDDLKKYCKYLIDEYENIKQGDGGKILIDLNQFYKEGKIKDLISEDTTIDIKIEILNLYRDKISNFIDSRNI